MTALPHPETAIQGIALSNTAPIRRQQSLMGLTITVSAIVGIVLCCAVAVIMVWNARMAIVEETNSAFRSANATVAVRMPRKFAGEDILGDAIKVAHEIDALRHVSAEVIDNQGYPIITRAGNAVDLDSSNVPDWFARLMSPEVISESTVISHYPNVLGQLVVSTDPTDEIAEVWEDFRIILPLLTLTGLVMTALTLFVSRMVVRRVGALQSAVSAIRLGDTSRRSPDTHLVEFAALGKGIDDLATFLAQERQANRKLQMRILKLSEAERSKIAFDLHDEMGPVLFALNLALAQAQGEVAALQGRNVDQLAEALNSSIEHARLVQERARAAINDLRPMLVGHAPLYEVVSELVSEFSSIAPGVGIILEADPDLDIQHNELAEISIYRFVRESILNAIRHGQADKVKVLLSCMGQPESCLLVRVTDNGFGPLNKPLSHGYGLSGINDRAMALGAHFTPPKRQAGYTVTELRMPF